jgi:hypothetical protein
LLLFLVEVSMYFASGIGIRTNFEV